MQVNENKSTAFVLMDCNLKLLLRHLRCIWIFNPDSLRFLLVCCCCFVKISSILWSNMPLSSLISSAIFSVTLCFSLFCFNFHFLVSDAWKSCRNHNDNNNKSDDNFDVKSTTIWRQKKSIIMHHNIILKNIDDDEYNNNNNNNKNTHPTRTTTTWRSCGI